MKNTLKSIELSYLFAKKLYHGISDKNSDWKHFEPTKFIYSFFAFNMLYEYDWTLTFERKRLILSDFKYTNEKINSLLDFIYLHNSTHNFPFYYKEFDNQMNIITNSKRIQSDRNIGRIDKNSFLFQRKSFLENYLDAVVKIDKNDFTKEDHYKLIIFCYQIRNNIFHGMKKATQMIESGQRERLLDYSHLLIATMEMFFQTLSMSFDYILASDYEFKENAQIN